MENKRISYWDNVKFFLIMAVVVGHFINTNQDSHLFSSMYLWIWSFHMPLFVFLSGLFHKNKNITNKVVGYMSIYLVSKVLFYVTELIYNPGARLHWFYGKGLPWFVFALAVFILITYLVRDCNKYYVLAVALFLGIFAYYDADINDYLYLSKILVYFPCYFLGTMVSRDKIETLANNKSLKIVALLILVAWFAVCFLYPQLFVNVRPLLSGTNALKGNAGMMGIVYRVFIYGLAVVMGLSFMLVIPTNDLGCISVFGRRTLQVYFWHRVFLNIAVGLGVYSKFIHNNGIMNIVWIICGVAFTFLLSLKIFEQPTKLLLNPAKFLGLGENQNG